MPRNKTQYLRNGINLKGKQLPLPYSILRSDISTRFCFLVDLMIVPGAVERILTQDLGVAISGAMVIANISSILGLLVGHHTSQPSALTIIMIAGLLFICSILFGRHNAFIQRFRSPAHLDG